ncbi:unnamed protein product [Amoebophrya sp. A120]|nr:unnamed protein product [Amoebophrya sp. A120]|eukprot:GSA120T00018770001.1
MSERGASESRQYQQLSEDLRLGKALLEAISSPEKLDARWLFETLEGAFEKKLPPIPRDVLDLDPDGGGWTLGCVNPRARPDKAAVSVATRQRPFLTRLITEWARAFRPRNPLTGKHYEFSSIQLQRDATAKIHKDGRNQNGWIHCIALTIDEVWETSASSPHGNIFLQNVDKSATEPQFNPDGKRRAEPVRYFGPETGGAEAVTASPRKVNNTELRCSKGHWFEGVALHVKNVFQRFDGRNPHCTIRDARDVWRLDSSALKAAAGPRQQATTAPLSAQARNGAAPSRSRWFLGFYVCKHEADLTKQDREYLTTQGFILPHRSGCTKAVQCGPSTASRGVQIDPPLTNSSTQRAPAAVSKASQSCAVPEEKPKTSVATQCDSGDVGDYRAAGKSGDTRTFILLQKINDEFCEIDDTDMQEGADVAASAAVRRETRKTADEAGASGEIPSNKPACILPTTNKRQLNATSSTREEVVGAKQGEGLTTKSVTMRKKARLAESAEEKKPAASHVSAPPSTQGEKDEKLPLRPLPTMATLRQACTIMTNQLEHAMKNRTDKEKEKLKRQGGLFDLCKVFVDTHATISSYPTEDQQQERDWFALCLEIGALNEFPPAIRYSDLIEELERRERDIVDALFCRKNTSAAARQIVGGHVG